MQHKKLSVLLVIAGVLAGIGGAFMFFIWAPSVGNEMRSDYPELAWLFWPALGVLWSFINPLLQTLVYALVFPHILGNRVDNYIVYLVCGIGQPLFYNTAPAPECICIIYTRLKGFKGFVKLRIKLYLSFAQLCNFVYKAFRIGDNYRVGYSFYVKSL